MTQQDASRAHIRLSATLQALLSGPERRLATPGHLIAGLRDKAFSVLLFLFASINVIPAIPGTSSVLGLPLVILAVQRMRNHPVRLPRGLMNAPIPVDRFRRVLRWIIPRLQGMENYIRPRDDFMLTPRTTRLVDAWVMVIAFSVLVPLPFTAMFPAFCLCLIALGRMERDGRLVLAGSILGVGAVGLSAVMVFLTIKGVALVMTTPL